MIDEQNELLIQKCVDGELDVPTQQELLAQLDHVIDGWKVLALAYVEEQTWSVSFRETDTDATRGEQDAFAARLLDLDYEGDNFEIPQEVQCLMPTAVADHAETESGRSAILTQATCLAIALFGGILLGDIWRANREPAGGVGANGLASSKNVETLPDRATTPVQSGNHSSEPSYVFGVPGSQGDRLNVPVYPHDPLPEFETHSEVLMSDQVNEELRRLGYQVTDDERWFVMELGDGRRAVMPLQSFRFLPVGQ